MSPLPLSRELLARYGDAVPRYTSYPTAPVWTEFDSVEGERVLRAAGRSSQPLSVYVHLPFCRKLCLYCGCNMMVTRSEELVERYLAGLEREIAKSGALLGDREVTQLHWGGGTPTFLSCEQLRRVHRALTGALRFAPDAEQAIEIHPPVTTPEQLETLRALGFSRLSMGVQDFDPRVQLAVNRIQPFEQTRDLVVASRRLGFGSLNIDLMYGLPHQQPATFAETLDRVAELAPDRIALFGYAHVPQLKPHQKLIPEHALPGAERRLDIFELAMGRLGELGYRHIGLDHFAREDDELSRAQRNGTLRRDFMGYTAGSATELVGFGASAISELQGAYLQNLREVPAYLRAVEAGRLPAARGIHLSADDLARRAVIQALFCQLEVNTRAFGARLGISFEAYFVEELARLEPFARDGLVELRPGSIRVTAAGRILLRSVAAVFDAYLHRASAARPVFSKVV